VTQSDLAVDPAEIALAARLLREGRLVAFPTETVYGLGANALDPEAVARIYAVKGRPHTSPIIVHVDSIDMAKSLVAEWPETAGKLACRFWPGPLTLVLPARRPEPGVPPSRVAHDSSSIPLIVTAGLPSVGLRMPAHPVALALIRAAGVPLAAPSANRFTQLSPTTAQHVRNGLGSDADHILDGGPCQVGIESTVLSLTGPRPVLLRPGGIARAELETVIGQVSMETGTPGGAHPSPGMHPRHYSPRTRLLLIEEGKVPTEGKGIFLQHRHPPTRKDVDTVQMPDTAIAYAAVLYETLHVADDSGSDWIAADLPPDTPEWEAVLDRLRRAAAE